jgi:cystathionine gamma-lyase
MSDSKLRIETLAIHGGQSPEPITGAVMVPVFQTSTYAQSQVGEHTGYEYSRSQNPTREALERAVACLEGGVEGIAFGSGSAATAAVQHLLSAGDKVVCGDDVYGGTWRQFTQVFARQGIEYTFVDLTRVSPQDAIPEGTALVWLESPTNPLLKVADIAALAERAHAVGALVVVDNTFATPIFQRPLELGADLVLHSTTKYINGHSDVVGGIVVAGTDDLAERLHFIQNSTGAVPGIWDCWLTLRGVKTLAVRMARHQDNALALVAWLKSRPEVSRVYYPLDPDHADYETATRQMSGFGGMISFELATDLDGARAFCAATQVFTLAESLGGVESLIELPAAMTHASVPPDVRKEIGIVDGLVRISAGIEHSDDLIADLAHALDVAFGRVAG